MIHRPGILHFMPDNFVWGGIESYLKQVLPILAEDGNYRIAAVVTQDSKLYHALKAAGLSVYGIPFPLREKSVARSLWVNPWMRTIDWSVYHYLQPILNQFNPDLVHVHGGRLEQSLIRRAGYPMVYTYHGYGGPYNIEAAPNAYVREVYKAIRPLFCWLIPHLSGMLVVSEYERQRLYREGFLPRHFEAEVLYNGLPTDHMIAQVQNLDPQTLRRELNIPSEARVISYTCRLRSDRNPMAFLRIARQVATDPRLKYPVHFLVAGDGKLSGEFEFAFKNDPVLASKGQYLGFRSDVPRLITASDLTVSTSLHEGFGLRVLESLLFGRPCIAYAAGGIPEVMSLSEAQDWLVPLGDEDTFVERLIQAINLPAETLTQLYPILQNYGRRFDVIPHVQQLELFYDRTLKKLGVKNCKSTDAKSPSSKVTKTLTRVAP